MALYVSITILSLCILALILRPLLMPSKAYDDGADNSHLYVYKTQLQSLSEDRIAGRISSKDADAMEAEIRRNLLAAARIQDKGAQNASDIRRPKYTIIALSVTLILPAIGLYAYLGAPHLPDQPLAQRDQTQANAESGIPPEMEAAMAELEDRLKREKDNPEAWYVLGRAKMTAGDPIAAVGAFREALRLAPEAWQIKGDLAAALTRASNGLVGPEADALFTEVLENDPREPRARYFLGIARAQSGQLEDALSIWRALEADSTPDAPWMPALHASIKSAAQDLGIDPATLQPEPQQSAQDQDAMIRAMVEGLAARMASDPENLEGWLRLAKSYHVLGDAEKARTALARAKALDPSAPEVRALADEIGIDFNKLDTP